jgi:hypothetical protein
MIGPGQLGFGDQFVAAPAPPPRIPRFGPHAPALPAAKANAVATARTTLTILGVGYILWTNFVIFTGGNAPLTPWHLSNGNAGAGTFMLFLGNWLVLLAFQLLVNGPIEYLLTGLLQPRHRMWTSPAPPAIPTLPPPPGWSVPVPSPSTPLAALLTTPQHVFVPQQFGSREYEQGKR